MSKRIARPRGWSAGRSYSDREGTPGSFAYSKHIEFRDEPTTIKLKPRTVKESGSVVDTEVTQFERVPGGRVYAAGKTKIYEREPSSPGQLGTWTAPYTSDLNNATSLIYHQDKDKMYIPDGHSVHILSDVSGTPSFDANAIAQFNDIVRDTTGESSYELLASINEDDENKVLFTPDLEPYYSVKFIVEDKGTGDWTATIHDATDAVIASKTITNANLPGNDETVEFIFDDPVALRANPGALTYHIHLTSSDGSGEVVTDEENDLETAGYSTVAYRLRDEDHPMISFLQYIVIADGNRIAIWEPITDDPSKNEWIQNRLRLPEGYKFLNFATGYQEFLAIGAYKSTSTDEGSDFGVDSTKGIILLWDGVSSTYNFFQELPEGAPESLAGDNGMLTFIANGMQYVWSGGRPVPIGEIPGIKDFHSEGDRHDSDVYLQAPQNGSDVHRNVLLMGYPYATVNDNMEIGVYSFGTLHKDYGSSFGLDHTPSHGDSHTEYDGDDVPLSGITALKSMGANLLIAWRHGDEGDATYGVDVVKDSNPPYEYGRVEQLKYDQGRPEKQKSSQYVFASHYPLPEDAKVRPIIRIDGGSWQNEGEGDGRSESTEGDLRVRLDYVERFYEAQIGVELIGSEHGSPEVKSLSLIFEDNQAEGI